MEYDIVGGMKYFIALLILIVLILIVMEYDIVVETRHFQRDGQKYRLNPYCNGI